MARGEPGRFTIKVFPRTPAVARDKIAVGTFENESARIASPKPGNSFSRIARVASGVTSRIAGPVPPVVTISAQSLSHKSVKALEIRNC
jgi:hypothetical protein